MTDRRAAWAAAPAVALVGLTAVTLGTGTRDVHPAAVLWLVAACWALFACASVLVRRLPADLGLRLIVGVGVALQAVAVCWPPRTSSDVYRYAWDGRVGNHGIDPYAYPPAAPQLAGLRVPWLFPAGQPPLINRPDVTTIYPPVGQLWFRLVDLLGPDSWGIRSYQVAAAVVAVAGTFVLVAVLRSAGRDPRAAAWWAWCPLVVLESGNNGHLDGLAAVLTVGAIALLVRRRSVLGGLLLGAAIGVKLVPGLVLPAVLRRRPWVVLASAGSVLVASYVPHVIGVGRSVIGYLPGYLGEEGYDSGDRFALLRVVMPQSWAPYAAAVVGLVTAALVLRRGDPDQPWRGAVILAGTALLITTPTYPWYALLLVALVVPAGRPEWLAVAAAGYLPYLGGWIGWSGGLLQQVGYGLALVAVVAVAARRASGVLEPVAQQGVQEHAGDGAPLGVPPRGAPVGALAPEPHPARPRRAVARDDRPDDECQRDEERRGREQRSATQPRDQR